MKYTAKSFTVPAVEKPPAKCEHGWVNPHKGTCVMCGAPMLCWSDQPDPWANPDEPKPKGDEA